MGDQHGFFQNIKSVQLEETKRVESQCIRDEEERLLRDKGRIRERWVRFFRSLLNSKSDMTDADIPKRLPQHPVASALGIEPTEEEINIVVSTPHCVCGNPSSILGLDTMLRKASAASVDRRLRRYYLIVRLLPNVFALACLPLSSI